MGDRSVTAGLDGPAAIGYISEMEFIEDDVQSGLRLREFSLRPDDGRDRPITGALWQQPGADRGAPLVCFGHGASGDRFQQPIPWLVERLVARHGFTALSLDGPVHGRRQVGDGVGMNSGPSGGGREPPRT